MGTHKFSMGTSIYKVVEDSAFGVDPDRGGEGGGRYHILVYLTRTAIDYCHYKCIFQKWSLD
jgi:hypothetical protein